MPRFRRLVAAMCAGAAGLAAAGARADDADALGLVSAPESATRAERPFRLVLEAAAGRIARRDGAAEQDSRRLSVDFNVSLRPMPGWKLVVSDRLDDLHPVGFGARTTLNSLREAYVGWQSESAQNLVEFGRINYRNGPAYGYNPTDFFRDGANRAVTSEDPLAQRENRLGTVMLRAQRIGDNHSVSLAIAPKIKSVASDEPMSPDFGATNHSDRALLVVGGKGPAGLSGQLLVFAERGKGLQFGAGATALLSDSAVAFAEWTRGRDTELLSEALAANAAVLTRQRFSGGLTFTFPTRLALTFELEYNGFAARQSKLLAAAALGGRDAVDAYLFNAQRRQEIASRKAYVVYATQADAMVKNLDVTGLFRVNGDDHSRFVWLEARYHLPKFDLALQWQQNMGRTASEYGGASARRLVQVLAALYF